MQTGKKSLKVRKSVGQIMSSSLSFKTKNIGVFVLMRNLSYYY